MEIRFAGVDDIDAIQALFYQLDTGAIREQPEHFRRGQRTVEYLSSLIHGGDSAFVLAVKDGNVIGFSLVFEKQVKDLSLLVPCKYGYVQDLVVTESERGHGYGRTLMDASKRWAAARGCAYLRLSVLPGNADAIRFYQNLGMREQMITMECPI